MDTRRAADRILSRALDLEPEERERFVLEACGADDRLAAQLVRLLASAQSQDLAPGGALAGPLAGSWLERDEDAADAAQGVEGERLGPWRLVEEIGRGGMAVVFLAERADGQFSQRAAVKLIKRGVDTDEVVARFAQERQILASLQHANIARLLDGGVAPDGRPWFAMEHVDGEPIDRWADTRKATARERVAKLVVAARAVAAAHRRLVVHRDLKPSNILVTRADEVKLLDFGIAKLLDPEGWEGGAPATLTAMRLLTPEYASPEQLRGEPVTTSSDVYQLGLLLYELLTGRRARRSRGSIESIERSLAEERLKPSAAVTRPETGSPSPEEVAAARATTPDRLRRELSGDLDAIVARTLALEPEKRYGSAEQLADDLERWLEHQPVQARRASLAHRARSFVRRHKVGASFAAAAALFVALSTGTLTVYAGRVARERDRARVEARKADEVRRFLLSLFEGARPGQAKGHDVTAAQLLERGKRRLSDLAGEPETRVELLGVLGTIYRELGDYAESEALLEEGLRRLEKRGETGPPLPDALARLGDLRRRQGRFEEAEVLLRRALALWRAQREPAEDQIAGTLGDLGLTLNDRGLYAQAEPVLREALAREERLHGSEHLHVAASVNDVAFVLERRGNLSAAEDLYRRAAKSKLRLLGGDHPSYGVTLHNLARALQARGDLEQAETVCREALAVRRKALGPRHSEVALTLYILAKIRAARADAAEAEALYREALDIQREAVKKHPQLAWTLTGLAGVIAQRNASQAEGLYLEALGLLRSLGTKPNPTLSGILMPYGSFLCARGRAGEALPLLEEARRIRREFFGKDDPRSAETSAALGTCLAGAGRAREGIALLEESVRVFESSSDRRLSAALAAMARAWEQAGNSQEAQRWRARAAAAKPSAERSASSARF
jgi:serine/threonine protein kinase/Tfp pilus assembly protein PilF